MKKIKLIIREKGRYILLPGMNQFRTPAKIDVTKIKLSILIQSLHSCGITNFELISSDTVETVINKNNIKLPELKKKSNEIDNRLDRMEVLLTKLVSDGISDKSNYPEQTTKQLNTIESLLKKGNKVIYSSDDSPIIEEIDDQYIPEIDLSEMEISGKLNDVLDKKVDKDIDDAADLLSNLTKNGGK